MAHPISAMFGRIAGVYDLLNHVLSFGVDRSWRGELAELAPEGSPLLDLAAGTLDVSLALRRAKPEALIIAMDFCLPMLIRGQAKLANPELMAAIAPCCGDAFNLPLAADSVAGITIAFGIRNIRPRGPALSEMLRVLKPGGRLCILEFGSARERIWGGIYNIYLAGLLPLVGRLIARDKSAYSYLATSIREFPTAPEFMAEMQAAGFQNCAWRKLTGGITCLHWAEKPGAEA